MASAIPPDFIMRRFVTVLLTLTFLVNSVLAGMVQCFCTMKDACGCAPQAQHACEETCCADEHAEDSAASGGIEILPQELCDHSAVPEILPQRWDNEEGNLFRVLLQDSSFCRFFCVRCLIDESVSPPDERHLLDPLALQRRMPVFGTLIACRC